MTSPAASSTSQSTMDVARALVALCREGRNDEAIASLYAPDVVSVEAGAGAEMSREVHGIEGVIGKGKWWVDNHKVHDSSVGGPWPHDDRFICTFRFDVTNKPSGQRFVMEEAALYTVRDGKIVREEFFYAMGM
ncbi:MAG: nuclear transport factor 2 family protein [Gemmatimonadota bacterium]